eukprot:jgi/Phyca11/17762/fgenesh1_pg.PHYCAscaffold_30_\
MLFGWELYHYELQTRVKVNITTEKKNDPLIKGLDAMREKLESLWSLWHRNYNANSVQPNSTAVVHENSSAIRRLAMVEEDIERLNALTAEFNTSDKHKTLVGAGSDSSSGVVGRRASSSNNLRTELVMDEMDKLRKELYGEIAKVSAQFEGNNGSGGSSNNNNTSLVSVDRRSMIEAAAKQGDVLQHEQRLVTDLYSQMTGKELDTRLYNSSEGQKQFYDNFIKEVTKKVSGMLNSEKGVQRGPGIGGATNASANYRLLLDNFAQKVDDRLEDAREFTTEELARLRRELMEQLKIRFEVALRDIRGELMLLQPTDGDSTAMGTKPVMCIACSRPVPVSTVIHEAGSLATEMASPEPMHSSLPAEMDYDRPDDEFVFRAGFKMPANDRKILTLPFLTAMRNKMVLNKPEGKRKRPPRQSHLNRVDNVVREFLLMLIVSMSSDRLWNLTARLEAAASTHMGTANMCNRRSLQPPRDKVVILYQNFVTTIEQIGVCTGLDNPTIAYLKKVYNPLLPTLHRQADMNTTNFSRVEAQAIAQRNQAPKQQLPLRRGHFGRVRMTRDDLNNYITTAKSVLDDALNKAREDRNVGNVDYRTWKQIGSHAGFKRFTKTGDNSRDLHYRLQGTVRASLNDLMGIMYADSTAQVAERRDLLYNDSLDAQTLCVLKERSAENMQEHISIRWQAINLSNNSPIYQRDMCFLEYTGVTTDVDGIPVGFSIKQSIERKECVSLKETHGLSRLDFTEIMLLRPTQNASHTELILDGVVRHPENLPGWLVSSFLGSVATCMSKLPIVVQERLLARLPMISDWQFVPLSSRKTCHVCSSKFSLLSKKANCRSCGEVACKSCIVTRTVGETTKFCTKCILMVSTQTESIVPSSDFGSASFITSSSSDRSRSRRDSETSVSTTSSMQ